ncbi:MAG: 3-hydroxyacyl-ACP dehydratase FabZ [Deltaproteobacteria bacterium]|nr:3-hydroxyacyl-ACP dehydratase FabZ [Deltaproteobacteria bacterium]MBW1929058.1 3-hydroxyacyl-ACP dehydratase FabZ [Deltaproteobacteria bacterium]MBW2024591.1 3-hydroxyacyl-ACP dehydratase FabZ [Deltaproteobacteria bacterium]MBW2125390.1 3-hydroxyacyl-ACP dehydratase FabZ [Deltaproteobacteria bacterium]RLB16434.1 MAG: 3-hydroxyacyl-[acyl-carrier-protein] dehydratase FabZ [Deltaproteobacteria bacterium]
MEPPLNYKEIIQILPHRYPFLLVDRIIEMEKGKRVVGIKNVTANEPFFQGHFPGNPIMPGVLIVEAMAQVGGVLARLSVPGAMEEEGEANIYFMAMDKVKFRRPVIPGDQIRFELEALRTGSRVWKMAGKAFVGRDLVAEAEITASIG